MLLQISPSNDFNTSQLFCIGLLLCMGIGVIVLFWERFWVMGQATKIPNKLLNNIAPLLKSANTKSALELCEKNNTPCAKNLSIGIALLGRPLREMQEAMQQDAQLEIGHWEARLGYLILLAELCPAIGTLMALMQLTPNYTNVYANALPFLWLGWGFGLMANVAYNILIIKVGQGKYALEKTLQLWTTFLQSKN